MTKAFLSLDIPKSVQEWYTKHDSFDLDVDKNFSLKHHYGFKIRLGLNVFSNTFFAICFKLHVEVLYRLLINANKWQMK